MSDVNNDYISHAAAITAAYVGNPNHTMPPDSVLDFFGTVHQAISGTTKATGTPALPEHIRQSIEGSVMYVDEPDPAKIWPDATEEQRKKFSELMRKHNVTLDAKGVPVPRRSRDQLVEDWKVYDPFTGKGFKMLKRHLTVTYDMDINELRAFWHLPADFPVTAPAYSASKAQQAEKQGLGRNNRKGADTEARKAAAAKPAKARTAKAKTAKATTAAGKATTAAKKPATGKAAPAKGKARSTSKRTKVAA